MDMVNKTFYSAVMFGVLGILLFSISTRAQAQSTPSQMEESVEFSLTGETYMSNNNRAGLMLDLVEKLQNSKFLEHISVSSSQQMGSGADTTADSSIVDQFEIEAVYRFNTYEEFQTWYRSDDMEQYIEMLQQRLNRLNMELNVASNR